MRDTLTMRIALAFGAALLGLPLFSLPASAALNVCNHTATTTRLAVGRFDGTAWISEGWWVLTPKQCGTVVPGKLKARYYYLYAVDGGAGAWGGTRNFCVGTDEDKFVARGRENCAGRGMDRKGFFPVDTKDAPDYTQTLSD